MVAGDACLGRDSCGMCGDACPYDVPRFGPEENARMQKCDFCTGRIQKGRMPICVESCPMRALDAGPLEELTAKYGNVRDAEGFVFDPECNPSVIYTPSKDHADLPVKKRVTVP